MTLLAMSFVQCNSLGNTFLLYDLSAMAESTWQERFSDPQLGSTVRELCQQHGKDGVLLVYAQGEMSRKPVVDIINSDGSPGDLCLNGARCAALYLGNTYKYSRRITLRMGNNLIDCQKKGTNISVGVPVGQYRGQNRVNISDRELLGYMVDVGNPHFLIFDNFSSLWLKLHGEECATHPDFTNGTNIEIVQKLPDSSYSMHIYERGVGYSQACSSACVALITLLFRQKSLPVGRVINIIMPGGSILGSIDQFGLVQIEAEKPHLIGSSHSD